MQGVILLNFRCGDDGFPLLGMMDSRTPEKAALFLLMFRFRKAGSSKLSMPGVLVPARTGA